MVKILKNELCMYVQISYLRSCSEKQARLKVCVPVRSNVNLWSSEKKEKKQLQLMMAKVTGTKTTKSNILQWYNQLWKFIICIFHQSSLKFADSNIFQHYKQKS